MRLLRVWRGVQPPCALRALSPHAVDRHGCSPHPPASVYPRLYMIALLQYGIALRVPLDLNILFPLLSDKYASETGEFDPCDARSVRGHVWSSANSRRPDSESAYLVANQAYISLRISNASHTI